MKRVAANEHLIERLGVVLPSLEPALFKAAGHRLLPQLVEDWQLSAAHPLLNSLDKAGLAEEVRRLGEVNGFAAESFSTPLIQRARDLHALEGLREALIDQPRSERRDAFLAKTLEPTNPDVRWLLSEPRLDADLASAMLVNLLRDEQTAQLCALLSDGDVGGELLSLLRDGAPDLLLRAALEGNLAINNYVDVIMAVSGGENPRINGASLFHLPHGQCGGFLGLSPGDGR